ncbi:MAG: tRNA 2-thiouridine(34) synthase MnmA [Nitrospirae bacterium]|nr:tRNA 2-thiouridine(34) synthase MnmA [Nitrospirota bacterium]
MSRETVLVGMSGGVDSAVAAALLVEQGYRVIGATLKIWEGEDDPEGGSPSDKPFVLSLSKDERLAQTGPFDGAQGRPEQSRRGKPERAWHERSCCKVGLARYTAQQLNIPYHVFDARREFEQEVVEDFCKEYLAGRTPNPCVRCNERIKFDYLLRHADELGADRIATGHYARIERDPVRGTLSLKKGLDAGKDQTYFLHRLGQEMLERTLFPLGSYHKEEVWKRAEALGLPVDEIRESQEVCFVTRSGYQEFLERRIPESVRPGRLVTTAGAEVGGHRGIAFHTVGQRRGLGVSAPERRYVVRLDPERNEVILGGEEDLMREGLTAREVHWIEGPPEDVGFVTPAKAGVQSQVHRIEGFPDDSGIAVSVKIRYRGTPVAAFVTPLPGDRAHVVFATPGKAVTPGQSVVFYDGDRVMGGGIIEP